MLNDLVIRNATYQDIDFIIETIIEAEKSFSNKISYCTIFSLSEKELIDLLKLILAENITGQELCYSEYLIAWYNSNYVGACSSWIEASEGFSSAMLKGSLLYEFLGKEKIEGSQKLFSLLQQINIDREKGTLQIVNAYVKKEFRGRGIIAQLILEHIRLQTLKYPNLKKVQLRPTGTNESAYKAYHKIGFNFVYEKTADTNDILNLLPAKSKILMEKIL
jgi:ribosomal protein S18 acetylase RimI-like enzyme